MTRASFLFLLLASSSLACAPLDETGASDDAVTIDPHGPGGDVRLTITVPAEVAPAPGWRLAYSYDYQELTPGVELHTGVRDGILRIAYLDESGEPKLAYTANLTLPAGATTLALGAIEVDGAPTPSKPDAVLGGVTFDPRERLVEAQHAERAWKSTNTVDAWLHGRALPVVPGTYRWIAGDAMEALEVVANANTLSKVITANTNDRLVHLVFQREAETFPNVSQSVAVRCTNPLGSAELTIGIGDEKTVFSPESLTCHYEMSTEGVVTRDLRGHLVMPGSRNVVNGERLDVDDITLDDEAPGTKVPGTFDIRFDGVRIASGIPTKHGLYLPGWRHTYHVTYHYRSLQGGERTFTQMLHF